jgi:hypothetical protein
MERINQTIKRRIKAMKNREVDNSQDVLDSRDVIARIEELESLRDDWQKDNELPDYQAPETSKDKWIGDDWTDEQTAKWTEWDESDEGQELKALKALADQCEGYGDWAYGETLIRDSYFQDYAEQFAEDIGAINSDATWPNNCIDWEKAADELQMDYTSVDWDGVTYWIR